MLTCQLFSRCNDIILCIYMYLCHTMFLSTQHRSYIETTQPSYCTNHGHTGIVDIRWCLKYQMRTKAFNERNKWGFFLPRASISFVFICNKLLNNTVTYVFQIPIKYFLYFFSAPNTLAAKRESKCNKSCIYFVYIMSFNTSVT